MTFTNKAAKEISERIAKLAGQSTKGMFVGTIHRLAGHVLTQASGTGGTRIDAIAKPGSQHYRALERLLDDVLKADGSLREALAVRLQAHVRIPPSDGKHDEMVRVSLMSGAIDVRSHGEAALCRVLDERGIAFEYEAAYVEAPATQEERKQAPKTARAKDECLQSGYRPDFKITLARRLRRMAGTLGDGRTGEPTKGVRCRKTTQIRRKHAVETAHARSAENTTGGNALGPVRAGAPGQRRLGPHGGRGHRARGRLSPGITAGRGQRTRGRAQGLVRRADTGEIVFGRRVIPR